MILHIISITALVWLTYSYIVWKGGFVIDDMEGIVRYDGKLPANAYYGDYFKHLRFKVADKNPRHHHCFNVILKNAACVMLYFFLRNIIGEHLAWITCLLFAVTPLGAQTVGWVSGIGYIVGLFMALVALQIPTLGIPDAWGISIILYAIFLALAIIGNFTMLATFVITLWLGHYSYIILGALLSLAMGFQIVRHTINLRTDTFESQGMGNSTKLSWRKIIVATKSLLYYTKLALFPSNMGLYHVWGFHYTPVLEKENNRFWLGVLLLIGFGCLFYFGDSVVRFGIVWYFAFLWIYLNWITIHQFVAERYVYIASIGLWIIMAKFLAPYPVALAFVIGLYLMRTWQQLPAYQNEITFYQSNVWNFPRSEVALANLGATYMKCGLTGSAVDMWNVATRINPQYDVPYYNLYSVLRAQKQWGMARDNLVKAIQSPVSHFRKRWEGELRGFDKEVAFYNQLLMLKSQMKLYEARIYLIRTLAEQTKTPFYEDTLQSNVFKDMIQKDLNLLDKEIKSCAENELNLFGKTQEAGSSNSLQQGSSKSTS